MNRPPQVLVKIPLDQQSLTKLKENFDVLYFPAQPGVNSLADISVAFVRGILTNGSIGVSVVELNRMRSLEIVACIGVGYENVPVDVARARGIAVVNGAGANSACVADHAMALLLNCVRDVARADQIVRNGQWKESFGVPPSFRGSVIGIIGLGRIGQLIAKRAISFEMKICYHNRCRANTPYRYCSSVTELAHAADFLIVSCPGGTDTYHLVNREVLQALGRDGYLVNVGRGSVVDTVALTEYLERGLLRGAALDVFEGEPTASTQLLATPNLILSPHVAGRSPVSLAAMLKLAEENLLAEFRGAPLLTPI